MADSVLFPGSRPKLVSKDPPKKVDMEIYKKLLQGRFAGELNPEEPPHSSKKRKEKDALSLGSESTKPLSPLKQSAIKE